MIDQLKTLGIEKGKPFKPERRRPSKLLDVGRARSAGVA